MVTSANGLITSGKVDTEDFTYDAEDGYGRGTFSLPLSERLIPEAHVLVAVPAANGTLLADETKFEVDLSLLSSQPVDLEVQSIIVDDERFALLSWPPRLPPALPTPTARDPLCFHDLFPSSCNRPCFSLFRPSVPCC